MRECSDAVEKRPDLILLDLNMPGIGGHEVLSILKGSEEFRAIPAAILSSSSSESDLKKAYERHANCYIVKPDSLAAYLNAIGSCAKFWLKLAVHAKVATAD